jgi:hypothetical protein
MQPYMLNEGKNKEKISYNVNKDVNELEIEK